MFDIGMGCRKVRRYPLPINYTGGGKPHKAPLYPIAPLLPIRTWNNFLFSPGLVWEMGCNGVHGVQVLIENQLKRENPLCEFQMGGTLLIE